MKKLTVAVLLCASSFLVHNVYAMQKSAKAPIRSAQDEETALMYQIIEELAKNDPCFMKAVQELQKDEQNGPFVDLIIRELQVIFDKAQAEKQERIDVEGAIKKTVARQYKVKRMFKFEELIDNKRNVSNVTPAEKTAAAAMYYVTRMLAVSSVVNQIMQKQQQEQQGRDGAHEATAE